jgi:hypothetical protein
MRLQKAKTAPTRLLPDARTFRQPFLRVAEALLTSVCSFVIRIRHPQPRYPSKERVPRSSERVFQRDHQGLSDGRDPARPGRLYEQR